MPHWSSLPAEIRLMILELLLQEKRGSGSCAAVCKEWQAVIEKKNFSRLKLRAPCLVEFQQMVTTQKRLVKHIWLHIELRTYNCQTCKMPESTTLSKSNESLIKMAVSMLFYILSTWKQAGDGLTLEISAHSPSDTEHWFKNCYFGADNEDEDTVFEFGNQQQEAAAQFHDPEHGWVDGQLITAPKSSAISRLFGSELSGLVWEELPKVQVVRRLVLRRQFRRRVYPLSMTFLFASLPQLECVVYEPWRLWCGKTAQEQYDVGKQSPQNTPSGKARQAPDTSTAHENMIKVHLPEKLKRVSIFEDFNEDYTVAFQDSSLLPKNHVRIPNPRVSRAVACRSLDLEQLSVSFMADAVDFFFACQVQWTWDRLQSLALTSRLLTHTANSGQISNLLHSAGTAALSMPKLHIMTLWNYGKREACAFKYRNESNNPSITWRATWDLKLESSVIQVWERVASKYTPNDLRIRMERLSCNNFSSHGEAIYQLDLPAGVIDPTSLWQIRREGIKQR